MQSLSQAPSRPLIRRRAQIATLTAALAVACATGASAQLQNIPGQAPGVGTAGLNNPNAGDAKAAPPPPSAIPGAKARQPVIPATKSANDMDPNEALFDAINRGDIGAARDALNRGAELSATNVLGMTPMELSIDLGRNDISFLLLSMRTGDSSSDLTASRNRASQLAPSLTMGKSAPMAGQTQAAKTPTGKMTAKTRPTPSSHAPVAADKPTATPKLYAGDGGTPQPNAGFLGFGR
jgi:hypothetical protein